MQISEYKNIYDNESSNFYYVGYHTIIISLIDKYLKSDANNKLKILDAGCGTGLLAKKLSRFGNVQGIDINSEAVKYARKRGIKVQKASILKLPFKKNYFDMVICIDVIYHKSINNESKAFQEIYRVLKPNGLLILKLPAFNFLYSNHDLIVHGKRRYTKYKLGIFLKKAKLIPIKITYSGLFLFPIALLLNLYYKIHKQAKPTSSIGKVWQPLNKLLIFLFKLESIVIQSTNLPFGISILGVVKK